MFNNQFWTKMSDIVTTAIENQLKSHLERTERPMSIDELTKYLKLSKDTIYRYTSRREIPFSKIGGNLYFDRDEINKWLMSNKPKTAAKLGLEAQKYIDDNPLT